jgi:hypothetical protein
VNTPSSNPESTKPNVFQCIALVQAALAKQGISKDKRNQAQGYNFRGIDDVYNALSALMAEVGLVIVPEYSERTVTERESAKGGTLFSVVVRGEYRIYSSHDGSHVVAGPFWGEAMDSGDKATNKAMSASYKYMAMQVFAIPTEGDNDADATTHTIRAVAQKAANSDSKPASGVMESLSPEDQMQARLVASLVLDAWTTGKEDLAFQHWKEKGKALAAEPQIASWDLIPSHIRTALKHRAAAEKKAKMQAELATQA